MTGDWKEDARFVGAFIRGGSWEIGLRVARNVQPGIGQGTSSKSGQSRISLREFAAIASVSTTTISTYLKTWELAADDGRVDHAADLASDAEYFWEAEGLLEDDWKSYFHTVSEPKPTPHRTKYPDDERLYDEEVARQDNSMTDQERALVNKEADAWSNEVADQITRDIEESFTVLRDGAADEQLALGAISLISDASIKVTESGVFFTRIGHFDESQRQEYVKRLARLKAQVDMLHASASGSGLGFDAEVARILGQQGQ
jgi:hypothetical protein